MNATHRTAHEALERYRADFSSIEMISAVDSFQRLTESERIELLYYMLIAIHARTARMMEILGSVYAVNDFDLAKNQH